MEEKYRHELKYEIDAFDYLSLRSRLRAVMRQDRHASADGTYRIRSIYFDNYRDKALREKQEGVPRREKFRIRYYNDDLTRFSLEKKMKVHGLCMKFGAPMTAQECAATLSGDLSWAADHPNELVREFYCKHRQLLLKPRVLVSYRREPYLFDAGNVRVTVDSDIRSSLYEKDFFRPDLLDVRVADDPGRRILEVKFDAYLPTVIADLLQIGRVRQQAYSKYGACRRFG